MSTKRVRGEEAEAARQYLAGLICEKLLSTPDAAKATEIAQDLDPVGSVSPRLVRETLRGDRRFTIVERRWDLVVREELATRPVGGAITALLEAYGKPISRQMVAERIAASRKRLVEFLEDIVDDLLSTRPQYVALDSDLYALGDWLVSVEHGTVEQILFYNGLSESEELAAVREAIGRKHIKGNTPADTAERVIDAVDGVVSNKVLAFLVWEQHPASNPEVLLNRMLSDDRFTLLTGPRWCSAAFHAKLSDTLARLSAQTDEEAHEGEVEADLQAILATAPPKGTHFTVSDADLGEAVAAVGARGAASLDVLVTEAFELYPGDENFAAGIHALAARLTDRSDIVPVGPGAYAAANALPEGIGDVPPPLRPVFVGKLADDDLPMDTILTDTGIGADLAARVQDPENEDICEEDEVSIKRGYKPPEQVLHVVPHHHLQTGTLKARQIDRRVLPEEPRVVRITLEYAEDEDYIVWIDNEVGLLHGLGDWYARYVPGPGAIIRLVPTSDPLRLRLVYDGEADTAGHIEQARLKELLALRDDAQKSETSMYEIVSTLLPHHDSGAHFETLVAEANVVRRTTKRLVASALSSYHCFRPKDEKSGIWRFDEKAVEMGRIKAKKRYISAAQPVAASGKNK
ncbi:MAG: hypothetical protein PVH68_07535 [Armatimonadota bacterium]